MTVRTVLLAVVAVASLAAPAAAEEGLGLDAHAGFVTSSSTGTIVPRSTEWVTGACHYSGGTTASGTMEFRLGGEAVAVSQSVSQPELTVLQCTLTSPAQGLPGEQPTRTQSFQVACPANACATTTTVSGWPNRPVVICVDGYTVFGPPEIQAEIVHACETTSAL